MKKILKRLFYSSVVGILCAILAINIFSDIVIDDLKEYNNIYASRNYLYDSAIICTQLYFMNPNKLNKLTCEKINNKINSLNSELKGFYFANLYLDTMK